MKVHKGVDRLALVGNRFTVKLARTSPHYFTKYTGHVLKRGGVRELVTSWREYSADEYGFKHMLAHGIVANRREARLAKAEPDIVVPTHLVLGGLAVVQRSYPTLDLPFVVMHRTFAAHLGDLAPQIGHMVHHSNNFAIAGGKVRFLDAGSRNLEELTSTNASDIRSALGSLAAMPKVLGEH